MDFFRPRNSICTRARDAFGERNSGYERKRQVAPHADLVFDAGSGAYPFHGDWPAMYDQGARLLCSSPASSFTLG